MGSRNSAGQSLRNPWVDSSSRKVAALEPGDGTSRPSRTSRLGLGVRRSMVLKEHGALESCLTEFLWNLDGTPRPLELSLPVRPLLRFRNLDGQLRRSVEYRTPWFANNTAGTRGDCGPDVGHPLVRSPRTVIRHRDSGQQTEMARASTQQPIGRWATAKAVAYGECVCKTQPTSGWSAYIAVCIATTAPWMGGRYPREGLRSVQLVRRRKVNGFVATGPR